MQVRILSSTPTFKRHDMATLAEKEKLVEVLKFTPRKYTMAIWGYGVEHAFGHIPNQDAVKYMADKELDWEEVMWKDLDDWTGEGHKASDHPLMSEEGEYLYDWSDIDNLGRCWGAEQGEYTKVQILDENGVEVMEFATDTETLERLGVGWSWDYEADIDDTDSVTKWLKTGKFVAHTRSVEKGTFFEAEIELTEPFDITKLRLTGTSINDWCPIIDCVTYGDQDLDNYGGDTTGKSLESVIHNLEEWI